MDDPLIAVVEPLLLTVPQTASRLNVSESTVYRLIADEALPTMKIGSKVRVPTVALRSWISARTN